VRTFLQRRPRATPATAWLASRFDYRRAFQRRDTLPAGVAHRAAKRAGMGKMSGCGAMSAALARVNRSGVAALSCEVSLVAPERRAAARVREPRAGTFA